MIRLFIFIIIASLIFSMIGFLIYQIKNYKTNVPDNVAFKNDYLDKIEYSLNELKTRFGTTDSEIIKLNEVQKNIALDKCDITVYELGKKILDTKLATNTIQETSYVTILNSLNKIKNSDSKVIIIGDRDGIPGPAIEECVKTTPAEVVFSSTECFV